jgi:hypothetical protein
MRRWVCGLAAALVIGPGCGKGVGSDSNDVVVDTQTEAQWAQYVADVGFAEGYAAHCQKDPTSARPRVIVTGFGRFLDNVENATGRMLSRFVPGLEYPLTSAPPEGEVDDPAAQLRVSQGVITLDGVGEVDVCGVVLPVFWDVASIVVLKEAARFEPDLVVMNGIAGEKQPIWLELGALNEAVALPDGSGTLAPIASGTPLLPKASEADRARGNLLSWSEVREAAEWTIADLASEQDANGVSFGDLVGGVRYAGYPRTSNTYLCNNTTYAVGYVMDHPEETVRLLEPSVPREGGPTGVDVTLEKDMSGVPRVFVHWPSALAGEHLDRGAAVMQAIIGAQLHAFDAPTRGDNAIADFTE